MNSPSKTSVPQQRSRRWQISLREIFLLVVTIAAVFGWIVESLQNSEELITSGFLRAQIQTNVLSAIVQKVDPQSDRNGAYIEGVSATGGTGDRWELRSQIIVVPTGAEFTHSVMSEYRRVTRNQLEELGCEITSIGTSVPKDDLRSFSYGFETLFTTGFASADVISADEDKLMVQWIAYEGPK